MNGGAWLKIGGTKVDLIYRDLDEVLRWTAAAGDGQFEIQREVGYVAGIATYVLAGELALGKVLAGDLPRPEFPQELRKTAPVAWFRLAAGALHFAEVHAGRQDRVACLANLCQAVLAVAARPTVRVSGWGTRLTDATAVPRYVPAASWPARCRMTRLAPAWPTSNA